MRSLSNICAAQNAWLLREEAGLPNDYPLHLDSIRAEMLSQELQAYTSPSARFLPFLDLFRIANTQTYKDRPMAAPWMYSYANAKHPLISAHFGVSGPHKWSADEVYHRAETVRVYRRYLCWDGFPPLTNPEKNWDHGHCAENQSLPAVVSQCERLNIENIEIETLAMDKHGRPAKMCKNCEKYVVDRILLRNPTWAVVDKASGVRYTINTI